MKVKSLSSFNRDFSRKLIISVILLGTLGVGLHRLGYHRAERIDETYRVERMGSLLDLYLSTISEKLSVVAGSPIFLDYLRSGPLSRKNLKTDFDVAVDQLNLGEVKSFKIFHSKDKELVYESGRGGDMKVSLDLCYLNGRVDPELGVCDHYIDFYLDEQVFLGRLQEMNSKVVICPNCEGRPLGFDYRGGFPLRHSETSQVRFALSGNSNNFVYWLEVAIVVFVVLVSIFLVRYYHQFVTKSISSPIGRLSVAFKNNESIENWEPDLQEFIDLKSSFEEWQSQKQIVELLEKEAAVGQVASQVAHDIRSPLAALKAAVENLDRSPEASRELLNKVVERIHKIATDLLKMRNGGGEPASSGAVDIDELLREIAAEKRMEYAEQDIFIELVSAENQRAQAYANRKDLGSILSNLINNSVEACGASGRVSLRYREEADAVEILVSDDGCGIPDGILCRLGEEKVSHGKAHGNGIALYAARKAVESWGGDFTVESRLNQGTSVTLRLSKVSA